MKPFQRKSTATSPKRIGLLGGTFNPIHYGHLKIAKLAAETFQLDRVLFLPTAIPPHRLTEPLPPAGDRYRMVQLALKDANNPKFRVSRLEMKPSPSFAIDTINALKKQYSKQGELYYIIGADAAIELATWKAWRKLLRQVIFLVASRPGISKKKLRQKLSQGALAPYQSRFYIFPVEIPISGTLIRERLKKGASIRGLTPPIITKHIKERYLKGKKIYGNVEPTNP